MVPTKGKKRFEASRLIRPILVLGLGLLLMTACGKKGPPVPPEIVPPPAVTDLKAQITGNSLVLTWTGMVKTKAKRAISGYIVYRSKQKLSAESCEKCPILFEKATTVPVLSSAAKKKNTVGMNYIETLQKGYRYRYKVIATTGTGDLGGDSNIVSFTHDSEK